MGTSMVSCIYLNQNVLFFSYFITLFKIRILIIVQKRDDPRVHLHIADGSKFVKDAETGSYQVVIQDSSDPFTYGDNGEKVELPSQSLYAPEHFENIYRILSDDGIFNFQAESIGIESDIQGILEWRKQALALGFDTANYGSITISSYPTGQIGFLLCQKSEIDSSTMNEIEKRYNQLLRNGQETSYYHTKLQRSAFDLPLWAEKRIYEFKPEAFTEEK